MLHIVPFHCLLIGIFVIGNNIVSCPLVVIWILSIIIRLNSVSETKSFFQQADAPKLRLQSYKETHYRTSACSDPDILTSCLFLARKYNQLKNFPKKGNKHNYSAIRINSFSACKCKIVAAAKPSTAWRITVHDNNAKIAETFRYLWLSLARLPLTCPPLPLAIAINSSSSRGTATVESSLEQPGH